MSVKIGPRRKLKVDVVILKTFVPVMSEGIRSGVNWMRLNVALMMRATVFTVSVLAVPGTPSTKAWPSANNAIRICSIASSCPTITLCNSFLIWSTVEETYSDIGSVLGARVFEFVLCAWALSLHEDPRRKTEDPNLNDK